MGNSVREGQVWIMYYLGAKSLDIRHGLLLSIYLQSPTNQLEMILVGKPDGILKHSSCYRNHIVVFPK